MGEREKRSIVIVAACALVNEAREVLIAKRPPGRSLAGLWEFPGGKVEQGEEPEEALIRELKEELGIEIAKADLAPLTFASHAYPDFHLLMPLLSLRAMAGHARRARRAGVALGTARGARPLRHAAGRRAAQGRPPRSPMMRGRTMADRTRIRCRRPRRFAADRSGAAAVEYGLLMLIAIGVVFAVSAIGGNINSIFETLAAAFTN